MAGGTWVDQNKIRPGVYINYKSAPSSLATMGERGTVAIARVLDWGERGKFYTIADPSDCEQFGHAITDDEVLFIRQILLGTNRTQGASKILLWSLDTPVGSTAASLTVTKAEGNSVTFTAKSAGSAGNSLAVEIVENSSAFDVKVYNGSNLLGTVTSVTTYAGLTGDLITTNFTISHEGNGDLSVRAKTNLSGGVSGSAKATATLGNLVATAKYYGTFGNRLSVVITAGEGANFIIQTLLDGQAVDSQTVSAISGLVANDYVVWSGTGALAVNIGVSLTGGANGEAGLTNYSAFLDALEVEHFDILIYDGTDATTKSTYAAFVKALSNNEGIKCQAVISNYPNPDNECVISTYPQSVTLVDGSVLSPEQLTWWVGGASAGAKQNESLTYTAYTDAVAVSPLLTSAQQEAAINGGQFCLIAPYDRIQVLTDINCFRTFSVNKGQPFRKNRVVRTVFGVCNDIYEAFARYYIGAVDNDDEGRKSLKAEILNILNRYQGIRALQNVDVEDVTVLKGVDSDAVVIEIYIQPVDSVEKIYINITIS